MINDIKNTANYYYNESLDKVKFGDLTAAKERLTKSIQLYASKDALNLLGIIEYTFGEYQEAIHLFQRSIHLFPQDNLASQHLDELYSPTFADYIQRYNKGIEAIEQEDYIEAKRIFTRLFSQHQECLDLYRLLALFYCREKKFTKALDLLEKARAIDRGNKNIERLFTGIQEYTQVNGMIRNIKQRNRLISGILACFLILFIAFGIYQLKDHRDQRGNQQNQIRTKQEENYAWQSKNTDILMDGQEEIPSQDEEVYEEVKSQDEEPTNPQDSEEETMIRMKEAGENLVESLGITDTRDAYAKARTFYEEENYQEALELFTYVAGKTGDKDTYYIVRESIFYSAAVSEKTENYTLAKLYYNLYINRYENELHYSEALYNYMLVLNGTGEEELAKDMAERLKKEAGDTMYYNSITKNILGEDTE